LCAVGIASPANPRVVAYLSTWRQPPDSYHLELELPGESNSALTTVSRDAGTPLITLNFETELHSTLCRLRLANKPLERTGCAGRSTPGR